MGTNKAFPKEIRDFIYENYKGIEAHELTRMVNDKFGSCMTYNQVYQFKKNHKLRSGVITTFKPGSVPFTKGKKPEEYVKTPEALARMRALYFKKGNAPANQAPIGTEVDKLGYIWVKVAQPNKWRPKHLLLWENLHGPIPKGWMVTFLDGNTYNLNMDNLFLIRYAENGPINGSGGRDSNPDITKAKIGMIRLKQAIRERENEK